MRRKPPQPRPARATPPNGWAERISERVRAIPEGYVRTYGDIDPGAPRLVGRVLATTHDLPWPSYRQSSNGGPPVPPDGGGQGRLPRPGTRPPCRPRLADKPPPTRPRRAL